MSLLEQDTIRKRQVDQANQVFPEREKDLKFKARNNKKYEVKAIINSTVYGQQTNDIMSGFYYFVS